jgi:hypothetical protein
MNELITLNDIENEFQLGAIVRRKVGCSTYETEFVEDGQPARPAVIKIYELEDNELEPAVARWHEAMQLDHPSLLKIYTAGISKMEGNPVAYVVMERADESLAPVLAQRALTSDEVAGMLEPTLSALEFLHKNGYAHGSLKATNVFAAGDRLKLASECLVRFDRGGSAEDDVRALGALLLDVMTSPEGAYSPKPPFGEIVRCCLEENPSRRWTIEQVRERLDDNGTVPVRPAPVPQRSVAETVMPETPVMRTVREREPEPESDSGHKFPKWIFAALACLLLAIFLGAFFRGKHSAPAPAPAPTIVTREAPAPSPFVERKQPQPTTLVHQVAGKGSWSVIVAAYGAMPAAEKRAHSIAAKWPAFHVSVIERQREKAHYLVILGEHLSEDEAKTLKSRAVRSGLPRDTYIKKLT